jgi:lysozyme family protein
MIGDVDIDLITPLLAISRLGATLLSCSATIPAQSTIFSVLIRITASPKLITMGQLLKQNWFGRGWHLQIAVMVSCQMAFSANTNCKIIPTHQTNQHVQSYLATTKASSQELSATQTGALHSGTQAALSKESSSASTTWERSQDAS